MVEYGPYIDKLIKKGVSRPIRDTISGYVTASWVIEQLDNRDPTEQLEERVTYTYLTDTLDDYATTSDVNTALSNKANTVHTHPQYLTSHQSLDDYATNESVDTLLDGKADLVHTHEQYLTEHQSLANYSTKVNVNSIASVLQNAIDGKADLVHSHDQYLTTHQSLASCATKASVDAALAGKSNVGHTHTQYLTEHQSLSNYATVVSLNMLSDIVDTKADTGHTHPQYLTEHQSLTSYATNESLEDVVDTLNTAIATKANINHTHAQYLTEHQSLTSYATNESLEDAVDTLNTAIATKANTNHTHPQYLTEHQSLTSYATNESVSSAVSTLNSAIATKANSNHTHDQYLTAHQSLADYATIESVNSDVLTLNNAIATKANSNHTHSQYATTTALSELTARLNTLADSDDTTLDQLSEVVTYIKANRNLIDSITTDKANTSDLATVATTGNYNDLTNKPTAYTLPAATANVLGGVKIGAGLSINNGVVSANGGGTADSVDWSNVQNKPTLSTVATSGSYSDLTNKPTIPVLPTLATVATTGSYTDLTNKPTIPALPTLATVATSGSYNDLTDKPSEYSLPTNLSVSTLTATNGSNNTVNAITSNGNIYAGATTKTNYTKIGTIRKCASDNNAVNKSEFFTNSDGRSKFCHNRGSSADDAYMCFDALGFKLAYSGTKGTAAETEYDILHSGTAYNKTEVNSLLNNKSDTSHTHSQYLTAHQSLANYATTNSLSSAVSTINTALAGKSNTDHTHAQYLTEHQSLTDYATTTSMNSELANKADVNHTHAQYLTEHQSLTDYATKANVTTSINSAVSGLNSTIATKANTSHTHTVADITDIDTIASSSSAEDFEAFPTLTKVAYYGTTATASNTLMGITHNVIHTVITDDPIRGFSVEAGLAITNSTIAANTATITKSVLTNTTTNITGLLGTSITVAIGDVYALGYLDMYNNFYLDETTPFTVLTTAQKNNGTNTVLNDCKCKLAMKIGTITQTDGTYVFTLCQKLQVVEIKRTYYATGETMNGESITIHSALGYSIKDFKLEDYTLCQTNNYSYNQDGLTVYYCDDWDADATTLTFIYYGRIFPGTGKYCFNMFAQNGAFGKRVLLLIDRIKGVNYGYVPEPFTVIYANLYKTLYSSDYTTIGTHYLNEYTTCTYALPHVGVYPGDSSPSIDTISISMHCMPCAEVPSTVFPDYDTFYDTQIAVDSPTYYYYMYVKDSVENLTISFA